MHIKSDLVPQVELPLFRVGKKLVGASGHDRRGAGSDWLRLVRGTQKRGAPARRPGSIARSVSAGVLGETRLKRRGETESPLFRASDDGKDDARAPAAFQPPDPETHWMVSARSLPEKLGPLVLPESDSIVRTQIPGWEGLVTMLPLRTMRESQKPARDIVLLRLIKSPEERKPAPGVKQGNDGKIEIHEEEEMDRRRGRSGRRGEHHEQKSLPILPAALWRVHGGINPHLEGVEPSVEANIEQRYCLYEWSFAQIEEKTKTSFGFFLHRFEPVAEANAPTPVCDLYKLYIEFRERLAGMAALQTVNKLKLDNFAPSKQGGKIVEWICEHFKEEKNDFLAEKLRKADRSELDEHKVGVFLLFMSRMLDASKNSKFYKWLVDGICGDITRKLFEAMASVLPDARGFSLTALLPGGIASLLLLAKKLFDEGAMPKAVGKWFEWRMTKEDSSLPMQRRVSFVTQGPFFLEKFVPDPKKREVQLPDARCLWYNGRAMEAATTILQPIVREGGSAKHPRGKCVLRDSTLVPAMPTLSMPGAGRPGNLDSLDAALETALEAVERGPKPVPGWCVSSATGRGGRPGSTRGRGRAFSF